MPRLTIREFSKMLGLSTTQVSNAISGRGRVSEATRQQVLQAMQELGYTPDRNAMRLGSGRSYLVGLQIVGHDVSQDPFVMHLIRAMTVELSARDYDLALGIATDAVEAGKSLRKRAESRSVDATIVLGPDQGLLEDLNTLARQGHPCVSLGSEVVPSNPCLASVSVDLEPGAREVADLLVHLGHRRIGFIDYAIPDALIDFYAQALDSLDAPLAEDCAIVGGITADEGAAAMRELLSITNSPTAVFCRTDVLAIGAIQAAKEMGLRVPEDISVVGHDDLPLQMYGQSRLTTVYVDYEALGREAVGCALAMIGDPIATIPPRLVETRLIVRDTTGISAPN